MEKKILFYLILLFSVQSLSGQIRNKQGQKLVSSIMTNYDYQCSFYYDDNRELKQISTLKTSKAKFPMIVKATFTKENGKITRNEWLNGKLDTRFKYYYKLNKDGKIIQFIEFEYSDRQTLGKYDYTITYNGNELKQYRSLFSYMENHDGKFEPMASYNGCIYNVIDGKYNSVQFTDEVSDGKRMYWNNNIYNRIRYTDIDNDLNIGADLMVSSSRGLNNTYCPFYTEWIGLRSSKLIDHIAISTYRIHKFKYIRDDKGNIKRIEVYMQITDHKTGEIKRFILLDWIDIEYLME